MTNSSLVRKRWLVAALMCACLVASAAGRERQAPAAAAINPDATAALTKMAAYLHTLTAFQIRSRTSLDDVLEDGQKIQTDGTVDLLVQRPNRLRAEISSDDAHRMFYYDGKTFTIWARRVNYYAAVPAPPTLADLVERLADKYGIEVPLADLFYWGTDKSRMSDITGAIDVGPSQVDGVSCEHYAFRQPGLDWQIWIQNGAFPLPRKIVLTTTVDEARPQYTSILSWNLAPSYNDETFAFTPPPDAQKIVLAEAKPGGEAERR